MVRKLCPWWQRVYIKCFSKKLIQTAHSYYDDLVKIDDLKTKNIVIHEKSYKDLLTYFVWYIVKKAIETTSLYYWELIGNIEEYDRIKYLIVNDSVEWSIGPG